MLKPTSIIFGLKNVLRRKQKNLFAIFAVALGVSLIAGISITNDSLGAGFGIFFTFSLGERDGSITYKNGFLNESWADTISTDILKLENVTATSNELFLMVTSSTNKGLINIATPLVGIDENENSVFGELKSKKNPVKVKNLEKIENGPGEVDDVYEVYVGQALADDLNLTTSTSNTDKSNIFSFTLSIGQIQVTRNLTVKEIIKNEERGAIGNNLGIYTSLQDLQKFLKPVITPFGLPSHPVTMINIKFSDRIKSINDGNRLVEQMQDSAKNPSSAFQTFLRDNPNLALKIGDEDTLLFSSDRVNIESFGDTLAEALTQLMVVFGSIIIFAGLLLIVNIQLMTVEDREQQTGIQRAIGTSRFQIIQSNMTEFVITGIIGGIIGIFGGIFYSALLIRAFGYAFEFDGALIALKVAVEVPVSAFMTGFTLSLLTGLIPAIKASRINIVETLRGIENKAESIEPGTGMIGLFIGLALTVLGLMFISTLDGQPWDFPNAYRQLDDAESIFFASTLLLVGLGVTLSYFVSKDIALNISALFLISLPIFHIFFVFDAIREGSGGTNYILGLTMSMIIGNIMLIGLNLSRVADVAERIFSKTYSAVALLSFRQMASKRTRSTLTFAIFAVILTLNIFLASWSYSDRYGSVNRVEAQAGGSDVIIFASQPIDSNSTQNYLNGLNDKQKFPDITFASSFPNSGAEAFLLPNGTKTPENDNDFESWRFNIFTINKQSFWDESGEIRFNLLMEPNKLNNENHTFSTVYTNGFELNFETDFDTRFTQSNYDENEQLWIALAENEHVTSVKSGKTKPIIVVSPIAIVGFTEIEQIKEVGDSVWLETINKDENNLSIFKEFVIVAESFANPLFDSSLLGGADTGPVVGNGAFINFEEARDLKAFHPTPQLSYLNQTSFFLARTEDNVNSETNVELAKNIEAWSNGDERNSFRSENGLYGIIASSIYELYEVNFDGQFRFFGFIQTFTSFGFIVGVLGLLVVSIRSVQERKREIGMMRSLGLKKHEVIISIIIELTVMGIIGLIIGLFSGNILALGLVRINGGGNVTFLIPWEILIFYALLTLGAAFLAAIIPGRLASRIPPSEALRYTG